MVLHLLCMQENAVMTGEFVTIDELVGFLKDELDKAEKN